MESARKFSFLDPGKRGSSCFRHPHPVPSRQGKETAGPQGCVHPEPTNPILEPPSTQNLTILCHLTLNPPHLDLSMPVAWIHLPERGPHWRGVLPKAWGTDVCREYCRKLGRAGQGVYMHSRDTLCGSGRGGRGTERSHPQQLGSQRPAPLHHLFRCRAPRSLRSHCEGLFV